MDQLSQYIKVCVLSGAALFSASAHSVSFSGYAYGEFSNPVASYGDYTSIRNNDLGYYSNDRSVFNWGLDYYNRSSQFKFDGTASDAYEPDFSITDGVAFSLGDFTYYNKSTYYSSGVTGVDFDLNVKLNGVGWSTFDFSLGIDNTPNGSTNAPDYVNLTAFSEDSLFDYQGQSYAFEILGFSRDGGLTFENYTFADEHSKTTAQIYGRIQAVPVPAAFWLFGSGLIALASLVRRINCK
ncbi:MAG: hypothetical protein DIZ80_15400 [endosymbiont of Galathealinum brachiosum]|uniref:PEP-CTERM sorting domain-containing protein n=1 Tax=endosymbiont of Galathealinum brachiosum TaxID=2200906 RepID=A0A370D978_9GAMM|nr:MAG: hypothetical protein DIZ80_15400 [endosymbiont of Galathealinum brachiosum]